MRLPASLLALCLLAVVALPLQGQDYFGDIRPILTETCMRCHTEEGIAWSMEDPEEAFRRRRQIAGMILDGKMPPWLAEPGHQAYRDDISLSPETVEIVRRWREGGLQRGEPRPDPARTVRHASFEPDLTLGIMPGESYLPDQEASDEYRCFVIDWTPEAMTYVTGFRAVPGNRKVSHHVVVYAVTPEMKGRFEELTTEEDGLGYRCFGGALPDRLGKKAEREAYEARYPEGVRELNRGSHWLAHWAPGMNGNVFPDGTGLRMEPGSGLVVQMHYYTKDARGESDADTHLDFQLASNVERPAVNYPQTRNAWLAGERNGSMVIPAGEMATYAVSVGLEDMLPYLADVTGVEEDAIEALEIHSANLHMHAFGHSGVITLTDRNGRRETLLSIPRWDLSWQRDFTFLEPKVFLREDLPRASLAVECTYRNDTDETVYGGYGSFDEMCFNFSYIAVRGAQTTTEDGSGGRD
jgi:hypothetical protein